VNCFHFCADGFIHDPVSAQLCMGNGVLFYMCKVRAEQNFLV